MILQAKQRLQATALNAAQTPWQKKYPLVDNFISLLADDFFSPKFYSTFVKSGGAEKAMELFDTRSATNTMERELANAHDEEVDYESADWANQVTTISPVAYRFTKWFKNSYQDALEAHEEYA